MVGLLSFLVGLLVVLVRNSESIIWFASVSRSPVETAQYVLTLLIGLSSQFSILGTAVVVSFAVLVSVNSVLLVAYIRDRRQRSSRSSWRGMAHGVGGTVAAVLGIGCATCGTAVLFAVLSIFGAAGIITRLPLHGEEFGVFGVLVLMYSAWYLQRAVTQPTVC